MAEYRWPSTTRSGARYGPPGTLLDPSDLVFTSRFDIASVEVEEPIATFMEVSEQDSSNAPSKCHFNGLATGLSLTDFIGKYESRIRHWELRHPNFTKRQAFGLLGEYLGGDPLKFYNREYNRIVALTEIRKELGKEALEELPLLDPLKNFYDLLREQYRMQYPEQVAELKHFCKKPRETARQMYSRLQDLMDALPQLVTDHEAAQLFLAQLPHAEKRRVQLEAAEKHSINFTLDQVAPLAIKQEVTLMYLDISDPTSRAYKEARGTKAADKPSDAGTSTTPPKSVQVLATPAPIRTGATAPRHAAAAPAASAALPYEQQPKSSNRLCNRCGEMGHWAPSCPLPRASLICEYCRSQGKAGTGHLQKACFGLHPQSRPAAGTPAGQSSTGRPFNAGAARLAVPPIAAATTSAPLSEVQLAQVLAALRPQGMPTVSSPFQYSGCCQKLCAPATGMQLRPAAARQLPNRYKDLPASSGSQPRGTESSGASSAGLHSAKRPAAGWTHNVSDELP